MRRILISIVIIDLFFISCNKKYKKINSGIHEKTDGIAESDDLKTRQENERQLQELIKNNEFYFTLINQNGTYGGSVKNSYGEWNCSFGRS